MGRSKTRTAFPYTKCKRAVKSVHSSSPYGFHPMMHFDVSFELPTSHCKAEKTREEKGEDEEHSGIKDESLRLLFVHHLPPGAFIQSYNFQNNKRILTQHQDGYKTQLYFDDKSQFSEQLAEEVPPSNFAIEVLMDRPILTFAPSSSGATNLEKNDYDRCVVDLNFQILMHLRYQMAVMDDTTHKPVHISTPEIYMAYVDNEASPFFSSFEKYSFFPTNESSLFHNEEHVYIQGNQYNKITNCQAWDQAAGTINLNSPHAIQTLYVPVADARDFDYIVMVTDITYFITGTAVLIMTIYALCINIRRYYLRYRQHWFLRRDAMEMEAEKDKNKQE